jgi:hypothetical protein
MKILSAFILLSLFVIHDEAFESFIRSIPKGWSYTIKDNELTIQKDSSIKIEYCGLSPLKRLDTLRIMYQLKILRGPQLSNKEIKIRIEKQEQISAGYRKKHDEIGSKSTYAAMISFDFQKNKIDSLRLPFYSDEQYSYFSEDNLPYCYCVANDSIRVQLDRDLISILN